MATIEEWLAGSPPEIRDIALRAREVVFEELPEARELVDLGDGLLAFGPSNEGQGIRMRDFIIGLIPHARWVNAQFAQAVELPDPGGLLEGTGKRIRHVKLRTVADADRPEFRRLLRDAWAPPRCDGVMRDWPAPDPVNFSAGETLALPRPAMLRLLTSIWHGPGPSCRVR